STFRARVVPRDPGKSTARPVQARPELWRRTGCGQASLATQPLTNPSGCSPSPQHDDESFYFKKDGVQIRPESRNFGRSQTVHEIGSGPGVYDIDGDGRPEVHIVSEASESMPESALCEWDGSEFGPYH